MRVKLITNKLNILAFKDLIDEIDITTNSIIVVPDKFTLSAEQMFFEQKNVMANFSVRVFSLSKLANIVIGNELISKKIIDKSISLMIISSIIEENLSKFKYFTNIKDINQITEDIFNVISQIKSSKINDFNDNLPEILKIKFSDLKFIMEEYTKRQENYLVDASKKFDLFLKHIENSEFIKNHDFYFGMFNSLTAQVKDIIKLICKTAKSVTLSTSKSKNRINNNEVFDFYKSIKTEEEKSGKSNLNKIASFIEENFFTTNKSTFNIKNDEIKLFELKNPQEEIENLSLEIKKDILLNGLRYKDISICVTNMESYKELIKKEFNKQKFSFLIDENVKLIDNGYSRFVLDFLNILQFCNNKKVLSLIKNFYIDIDEDIKNNFEQFILKYSLIEQSKLTEYKVFKDDELYADYIYVFNNYVLKIYNFKSEIENLNIHTFYKKFNELLDYFNSKSKLNEKSEFYRDFDILKYKQYVQIEEKIFECEKNICEFYNEKININKLSNFMTLCFNNTTISVPCTSVDSIFVGDYNNSFYKPCKKMYVIGCDSKNCPNLKQDISLFTDKELENLQKDNIIEPKVIDANRLNYYKCFQTFLSFEENISISYSLIDNMGNRNFPSNIYKNFVSRFLKNNEKLVIEKRSLNLLNYFEGNEILSLLPFKFNSKDSILKYYYQVEDSRLKIVLKNLLENYYNEILIDKNDEIIDKNLIKVNNFTASNLENYFSCPSKFLFKEILKLKKFEPINLDAKVIGNIVHLCCYKLGQKLIRNEDVNEIEKNNLINEILNSKEFKFIYYLENSKQIIENLRNEILRLFDFIINEQISSEFKISKVEYKFEHNENGKKFKGFVDRIDENDKEFIIIDYKTGNTRIEYSDIVFNKKIQLFFYATILEKILNKKCVGIYYLSINDDFSKTDKVKIILNGITVNENNNLHKLDNASYFEKTIKSYYFDFKEKYLLNTIQFNKLKDYTYQNVLNAINEIKNANFSANPTLKDDISACEYCDYNVICKYKSERVLNYTDDLIKDIIDD